MDVITQWQLQKQHRISPGRDGVNGIVGERGVEGGRLAAEERVCPGIVRKESGQH
jgi:hypothetical protein